MRAWQNGNDRNGQAQGVKEHHKNRISLLNSEHHLCCVEVKCVWHKYLQNPSSRCRGYCVPAEFGGDKLEFPPCAVQVLAWSLGWES